MSLDELQKEINNLLYYYFNSLGVLQKDYCEENIDSIIELLIQDLKACKNSIDFYLNSDLKEECILNNHEEIIKDGEAFVSDGFYFIDKITNLNQFKIKPQ